jgi:hypothetical protein
MATSNGSTRSKTTATESPESPEVKNEKLARFAQWNPFAATALSHEQDDQCEALLAIAYEVSQLRATIHFASRGRS